MRIKHIIFIFICIICFILASKFSYAVIEKIKNTDKPIIECNEYRAINSIKKIVYVYDPETDICYGVLNAGFQNEAITVVPYEKVKDKAVVIEKDE